MDDRRLFTEEEIRQLLDDAARREAQRSSHSCGNLSMEEVREAARAAGISQEHLDSSLRRLESRRGTRVATLAFACGALLVTLGLLIWSPPNLRGWRRQTLSLHNEHGSRIYEVDLLVPDEGHISCDGPPSLRAAPSRYRLWRRVELSPRSRLVLDAPLRPTSCPMIWVRTRFDGQSTASALFEPPVGVEIERDGELDQRGAGHPRMYPPPQRNGEKVASP